MSRMKFGVAMFPHHTAVRENPTLQLERDLDLAVLADRLGFDEVWFGEHHSSGVETITSPELMIATAAERTQRVKLGASVTSLSYHHPLMITSRMVMLDHLVRGRLIWGMGPGSHALDALMMGIDPLETRNMMRESIEAIHALLAYDGPVTRKTDWFELHEAELQMRTYSEALDIRVASMASPSGPTLAGKYGTGILSIGATNRAGFNFLSSTWGIVENEAAVHGTSVSKDRWGLVVPMHLADTEAQARAEVRKGLAEWAAYAPLVNPVPFGAPKDDAEVDALIDAFNADDFAVIGTPDRAIALIEKLREQSGGAGTIILFALDWAEPDRMFASYELFARHVMPHFQDQIPPRVASLRRLEELGKSGTSSAATMAAAQARAQKGYEQELDARG
ncbi:LLM class flavin-dependent oxidoreductase [Gordonia terrae]